MLLRFQVSNHRSLRDPQELSLVASSLRDRTNSLISTPEAKGLNLLPGAIIYGANASGKSNIVSALGFLKRLLRTSHSESNHNSSFERIPFAFDDSRKQPTSFDVDFIAEGEHYRYELVISDDSVIVENLYSYPHNYERTLFKRNSQGFYFGRGFPGRNKIISDLTRKNSLFISSAAQNDHTIAKYIYDFFDSISVETRLSIESSHVANYFQVFDFDERIIDIFSLIETGVSQYKQESIEFSETQEKFSTVLGKALASVYPEEDFSFIGEKKSIPKFSLGHLTNTGELNYLELDLESAGTRRLLILLNQVLKILDDGGLMVIDELDASLHTLACELILSLFFSTDWNKNGAQIIATTHDTNLLRSDLLRRDQVWFAEKDRSGATHLYPLSDIKTRNTDNLEKGYLQGRYGAVPFSGSVEDLLKGLR